MKQTATALALVLCATFASGCIITDDDDSSLAIVNDSDYIFDDIRVAPTGSISWGPNLAPIDGLYPGQEVLVTLDCGDWDASVIDEEGCESQILGLYLCFDDADWFIRNGDLDAGCI